MQPSQLKAYFPPEFPPKWASQWGDDQYGLFADLTIDLEKQIIQRFRWIAAGEFMMGSPDGEKDRWAEAEDYHGVELTQGYWLASTSITQACWQLIMRENKSRFKHKNNPVERVSWDDAEQFINRLNAQLGLSSEAFQLRLPTEAEWEHACRAGTTTPFSFGENMTPEKVNYHGEFPYADGKKGLYREKTVAVKSLPINPWGLYEMHGNVWEWCADAWQQRLGREAAIDPYKKGDSGARRVVRGGSWDDDGGRVRSAFRIHYSPAARLINIGFRLCLGHVSNRSR